MTVDTASIEAIVYFYWPVKRPRENSECISIIALVVSKQYQFDKHKICFVLMQLYLMTAILFL